MTMGVSIVVFVNVIKDLAAIFVVVKLIPGKITKNLKNSVSDRGVYKFAVAGESVSAESASVIV